MPIIKLNKSEQRKLSLFITCLGIALFSWLFFALSNKYIYQVTTLVQYNNLPQNKAFHPLQSDTVKLQVQGSGWQILFARLRLTPHYVNVNLGGLSKKNYVIFSDQLNLINNDIGGNQKVVSVLPDTLYFDFSSRSVKRVPIVVISKLKFRQQFGVSDSMIVEPSYITVTGPLDDLAKITYWRTDTVKAQDVNSTVFTKIGIQKAKKANITVYPNSVNVTVPVDEFTEKAVDVPIKLINNSTILDVRLVPSKVKVTFLTSLGNYQNIDADFFEATVDLNKWKKWKYKQFPIILNRYPTHSKIIKVEPKNVDFMINK